MNSEEYARQLRDIADYIERHDVMQWVDGPTPYLTEFVDSQDTIIRAAETLDMPYEIPTHQGGHARLTIGPLTLVWVPEDKETA